jgi:hypothetical protein
LEDLLRIEPEHGKREEVHEGGRVAAGILDQ